MFRRKQQIIQQSKTRRIKKQKKISSTVLNAELKLPEAHQALLARFLADLTVNERSKATYHRNLLQFFLFLDHQKIELIACERATIVAYREHLLAQAE